jgi:hypothetical protein
MSYTRARGPKKDPKTDAGVKKTSRATGKKRPTDSAAFFFNALFDIKTNCWQEPLAVATIPRMESEAAARGNADIPYLRGEASYASI